MQNTFLPRYVRPGTLQLSFEDFIRPRELDFAENYVQTLDPIQSALDAGCSAQGVRRTAEGLMLRPHVLRYIVVGLEERLREPAVRRSVADRSRLANALDRIRAEEQRVLILARKIEEERNTPKRALATGSVYFVQSQDGLVKIGRAITPELRLRRLQTGSSSKLDLILSVPTKDPARLEAAYHRRFRAKHRHGEWFALTQEDIESVKQGIDR